jgi:beta-glucanase (GH16 family)
VSSPPPIICPAGVSGHCSSAAYPAYAGFTLNLVEDFDAPIDLASDPIWTYSDGVGDSRYSRYKKDALSFSDGTLIVTASKPASGVANADYPTYADGTQASYPAPVVGSSAIQTGEIRTKHNNYRYGRYEARMKAPWNEPGVRDYLIAAVFTHRSPKWQDWREVDVEATPYSGPTSIGTNIIYGDNCSTYDRTRNSYRTIPLGMLAADASIYDDFHTYAIELLPTRVTWFVDGTQIREETGAGVKLPERSMKLIVGVIIYPGGCDWTACTPPSYPMRSEIDWIRFYKYDGDDTYPCSPTPGCLPYEDRDYAKNNAEDGVAVVTGDI